VVFLKETRVVIKTASVGSNGPGWLNSSSFVYRPEPQVYLGFQVQVPILRFRFSKFNDISRASERSDVI
jgi:hypothetical protein